MQITGRDIEIIKFINEFGFCEMPHLESAFAIKKSVSYRLMRRLVHAGLIQHKRILHARHGIYYVTNLGSKCTGLPAIDAVTIGRYEHQCKVINVYLYLQKLYPDTTWISERRLKHEKFFDGLGKSGHLCDGMLIKEDKQIAIEVELSLKGKRRLEQIIKGYVEQFAIHEVWYFCPENLIKPITTITKNIDFIKVFSLSETNE